MSEQSGKVPIGECVSAAYSFLMANWQALIPAAAIGAAILAPVQLWAAAGQARQDILTGLLSSFVATVAIAPFTAAALRTALRGEAPRIRVSGDEANLAGVGLAINFLLLIVVMVGGLALAVLFAGIFARSDVDPEQFQNDPEALAQAIATAVGPGGGMLLLLALLAMVGLVLWISVRLSVANAATVGEGRMMAFSTWRWTKGNSLRILAATVLVAVPLFLAPSVVSALIVTLAGGGEIAQAVLGNPSNPLAWIGNYAGAFFTLLPVQAGLAGLWAYLYKGLRPPG
jgi:hypothetical protein